MATFHLAIHYYPYTGVKYPCKHILSQKSSAIFQASTWWRHRKLPSAEIKTNQASQRLTAFALCARTLFGTLLVGTDSKGNQEELFWSMSRSLQPCLQFTPELSFKCFQWAEGAVIIHLHRNSFVGGQNHLPALVKPLSMTAHLQRRLVEKESST